MFTVPYVFKSVVVQTFIQACFYGLAITYNLFPHGTKKKTIKDKLQFQKKNNNLFWNQCINSTSVAVFGKLQDWASNTGGEARAMGMHAMNLAARSTSSRNLVDMWNDVGQWQGKPFLVPSKKTDLIALQELENPIDQEVHLRSFVGRRAAFI